MPSFAKSGGPMIGALLITILYVAQLCMAKSVSAGPSGISQQYSLHRRASDNPTMTLPQQDSAAIQALRAAELVHMQSELKNQQRLYKVEPFPEVYELPRGPVIDMKSGVDKDTDLASVLAQLELGIIGAGMYPNLKFRILELLKNPGDVPSLETLEDIEMVYDRLATAIPKPFSLKNWRDDANFGDRRLTYSPHLIQKINDVPVPFEKFAKELSKGDIVNLCRKNTTLSQLAGENNLYEVNCIDFTKYNDPRASHKYTPGAHGLFCDTSKGLMPVAIKLSNGFVYSSVKSTASEWLLAKLALNVAENAFSNPYHFYNAHVNMEPIRTEMYRFVSTNHPIHVLMEFHLKALFGATPLGLMEIFSNGTASDMSFGWGAPGMMQFMTDMKEKSELDITIPFPESLKARGVDELHNFRYAQYGVEYYNIIKEFTQQYVSRVYPTKEYLRDDREIQSWAAAVQSANGAGIQNFPKEFRTQEELVNVLTNMIFLLTYKHNSMSSDFVWHAGGQPNSGYALWKPLPEVHGKEVDVRSFLSPTLELLMADILQSSAFYRKITDTISILNIYTDISNAFKYYSQDMINTIRKRFKALEDRYNTSEQQIENEGKPRFNAADPKRCPSFSWI
eukprot:Nk52_evm11s312 gene=Nk52_evmTU11s312